jgi:hypothetical protein
MLCYHCCNPYVTPDLSLPVKYINDTFETFGHFCSWECMKAYVIYSMDDVKFNKFTLISLLRHKMNIIGDVIDAPPKHVLTCFGGSVSIEEFRSKNASYNYLPVPMIKINPLIEKNTNISCVSHEDAHKVFEQTPEHKLQRKKSSSVANKLELSMGLIKQN